MQEEQSWYQEIFQQKERCFLRKALRGDCQQG